ncbi:MAG: LPS-assembly protein LptD [Bryobacterales bacterium]|nr:LPS-assembly protein LptD [Bryobacterales bacterium]
MFHDPQAGPVAALGAGEAGRGLGPGGGAQAGSAVAAAGPAVVRVPRITTLQPNEIYVVAVSQASEGPWVRLRGAAIVETVDMLLRADEIDYNQESGEVEARGNARFESFERGEELEADRIEYNMREERGKFYGVRGTAPAKLEVRPGLLTTANPFVFRGNWAERIGRRYILHDGFITNCKLPNPWWTLKGRRFDIVPGERAVATQTRFRLRGVPLFYTPYFYKSLEAQPRKSGFLMPNIGTSSRRGQMVGVGYFWAINRSYDLTYRSQLFTQRGFAHHVDLRGKPMQNADFNMILYGVQDKGLKLDDGSRLKQGGFLLTFNGKADLPKGFYARGEVNYLSSFVFRQSFTESFNEAVFSEVHSRGFVRKDWNGYSLTARFERSENYQGSEIDDRIVVRHLPQLEFRSRDRELFKGVPLWVSFDSVAGMVRRNQPLFQTRQFVERFDVAPRLVTALRWKEFTLLPYVGVRETHYGSTFQRRPSVELGTLEITGQGLVRHAQEYGAELMLPALEKVFDAPKWLGGEKLKHVIEARGGYRRVRGIDNFDRFIRFDEMELLSNTEEIDYSLSNRVYVKQNGVVRELLSWQLWQKRYLDPTFGGAVEPGVRNTLVTQTAMTGFAFLDGTRKHSPVVSSLQLNPVRLLGVEWRTDYDTERRRITNSTLQANVRTSSFFVSAGHNHVRSNPVLSPSSNQFIGLVGVGRSDLRGWSAGYSVVYDFRASTLTYTTTQLSYNSDCCGISFQYRRFDLGPRQENQWRAAFAISNIGSFGTLKRQERLF